MDDTGADELAAGLYDTILSKALSDRLGGLSARRLRALLDDIDPAELPDRMAEVVAGWIREVVAAAPPAERAEMARGLATGVLDTLITSHGLGPDIDRQLDPALRRLLAVEPVAPTDDVISIPRPLTPLRDTVLMTNARGQPTVGREIAA